MNVSDFLSLERIRLDVDATSRKRVLETLGALLAGADETLSERLVSNGLFAREKLGSTGIGFGVAIPHARIPQLGRALGAFLKVEHGIDFDAPDGRPVDLIFALAVPEESTEEHLEILAVLAKQLSVERLREQLRSARSPQEAWALLCDGAV